MSADRVLRDMLGKPQTDRTGSLMFSKDEINDLQWILCRSQEKNVQDSNRRMSQRYDQAIHERRNKNVHIHRGERRSSLVTKEIWVLSNLRCHFSISKLLNMPSSGITYCCGAWVRLVPSETAGGSENWNKCLPFRTSSDFHKHLLNAHLFFCHGMESTPTVIPIIN